MAKSLGEQLDAIQTAIDAVLTSQSYKMNGRELTRADMSALERREDKIIALIDMHGRDYIPGQNTKPLKMSAHVQFS